MDFLKNIRYKKTSGLCEDARLIREEVFVKEQGFLNEFDEIDGYAIHLVFYKGDVPISTCRYFKGKEEQEYIVGRIAILRSFRGKQLGNYMMKVLEDTIKAEGGKKISLSAQVRVTTFYEKNGYVAQGEPYLDEACEHIHMEKSL